MSTTDTDVNAAPPADAKPTLAQNKQEKQDKKKAKKAKRAGGKAGGGKAGGGKKGSKGKLALSEIRKKMAEIDAATDAKQKRSAGRKLVRRVITAIAQGSVPAPAQAAKMVLPLLAKNKKDKSRGKKTDAKDAEAGDDAE